MALNRRSPAVFLLSFALVLMVPCTPSMARPHDVPRNMQMGWKGKIQFGALGTFGVADTSAVSVSTEFTYRSTTFLGTHLEQELIAKFFRSDNRVAVSRRDANGDVVLRADGSEVQDRIRTETNDRRFLSLQPRWFMGARVYLFALVDLEVNEPADVDLSTRQVGGVGYSVWKDKKNYISAGLGVGRKKFEQVSGETEEGAIGYFALRVLRSISEDVSLVIDMESDFGEDNRFSEIEATVGWKLRDPVSVKFKYEARFNSNMINPLNTFDDDAEAALSVNLEFAVFR